MEVVELCYGQPVGQVLWEELALRVLCISESLYMTAIRLALSEVLRYRGGT